MTPPDLSLVLPAYRAVDHLSHVVPKMVEELAALDMAFEIIVVVNGPADGTDEAARALEVQDARIRMIRAPQAGWGRAVRTGLGEGSGNLLAYTNLARTPPSLLRDTVQLAVDSPGSVVKATRRVRDSLFRRAGSLLYNLECRALFDFAFFDVNGTPKVFPAVFDDLRRLRRDDDLIDAEFLAICAARGYRVVELPAPPLARHSGRSTTNVGSAWRMYRGAFELRRELADRGLLRSGAV
jgi:glycosyltransferase involved in cell wall biosynthesis